MLDSGSLEFQREVQCGLMPHQALLATVRQIGVYQAEVETRASRRVRRTRRARLVTAVVRH